MAGNHAGGEKTAETVKKRYGDAYFKRIGALGGKKSKGGGFSRVDGLASRAGRLGGMNSRIENTDCTHDYPHESFYVNGDKYLRCTRCRKVKLG